MRFITEEDLRQRFRRERFTEYEPEAGTRLTPGARQIFSLFFSYTVKKG